MKKAINSILLTLFGAYTMAQPSIEIDGTLQLIKAKQSISTEGNIRWSGEDFQIYKNQSWSSLTNNRAIVKTVLDIDGNEYQTMFIGGNYWFLTNLRVTHYNTGPGISNGQSESNWNAALNDYQPAYCYPEGGEKNLNIGALYNRYIFDRNKNICPVDWHISTSEDWNDLISFYHGSSIAAAHLKKHDPLWMKPNIGDGNDSGFSAYPAGIRAELGQYIDFGIKASFYSDVKEVHTMNNSSTSVFREFANTEDAHSIRCVKDKN